jgi:hypothetical protein
MINHCALNGYEGDILNNAKETMGWRNKIATRSKQEILRRTQNLNL